MSTDMAEPDLEVLADKAVADLRRSASAAREVITAMRATNHPRINSTLGALYATGHFTLEDLGEMVGLTRERVRQRIAAGDKPMRVWVGLTRQERTKLRELHAVADGRNPARREQVAAYRDFIYDLTLRGVSQGNIAGALGLTRAAIAQQLRLREQGAPGRWPVA